MTIQTKIGDMDKSLKDKSVIIIDNGSHIGFAQRLSREIGTIYYHNPSGKSSYPAEHDAAVGEGLEGIIVSYDFWDDLKKCDAVFFLDLYHDDWQEHLVSLGYPVWGAKEGEEIETERIEAKKLMRRLGLPVNKYDIVIGMDKLREYLKNNEDVFVKVSRWRGDGETFHSENYQAIESKLNHLQVFYGAMADKKEFCVEKPIDAVCEVGLDLYCIDGQFPEIVPFGYEIKDMGYACTVKPYKDLSPLLTDLPNKFADTMRNLQYRSDFSTEHRITKKKVSYCIDIVAGRKPSPPSELLQELISNWGEIMFHGAAGKMIQPEYEAKFGVEIIIHCTEAEKEWVTIQVPEEIRRWVKLKNVCYYNDAFQYIPQSFEMEEIGAVVAIGASLDECVEKVREYCSMIIGHGLEMNTDSIIDKLQKQIDNGESIGIEF